MENMNVELYRIVSLEGFLSLLFNKTERYVRPIDGWEDTFEGDILHWLDNETGEKKIIDILYSDLLNNRTYDSIRNYVRLLHAKYLCYGQCWSTVRDSDAMWRIYSYGMKSIQLVTTAQKIYNTIVDGSDWAGKLPRIEKVKYDSSNSFSLDKVPEYFARGMYVDEPYFHKREAFAHENEVRVILNDMNKYRNYASAWCGMLEANYSFTNMTLEETRFEDKIIEAGKKLKENDGQILYLKQSPKELYIKINDICNYVIGVRVHPQAEDWYVSLIETICKQHGIAFMGKSDLYKLPL